MTLYLSCRWFVSLLVHWVYVKPLSIARGNFIGPSIGMSLDTSVATVHRPVGPSYSLAWLLAQQWSIDLSASVDPSRLLVHQLDLS